MKKVAIIGSIGSGKSHICRLFEKYKMPVFYFDDEAKNLYNHNDIVEKMIDVFGEDIYDKTQNKNLLSEISFALGNSWFQTLELNKSKLADIIFNDDYKRKQVVNIINPELFKVFYTRTYKEEYVEKNTLFFAESANMIDSNLFKIFDEIIIVTDDYEKRKEMVMEHRGISNEEFERRNKLQLSLQYTKLLLEKSNVKYTVFTNEYNEKSEEFVLDYIKSNI